MQPKQFIIRLSIFTLVLLAIIIGLNEQFEWTSNYPLILTGLFLFVLISILSYRALFRVVYKRPALFVNRFMATTALKLFVFIFAVIALGMLIDKPENTFFILYYMALYVLYMIFYSSHIMQLKSHEKAAKE